MLVRLFRLAVADGVARQLDAVFHGRFGHYLNDRLGRLGNHRSSRFGDSAQQLEDGSHQFFHGCISHTRGPMLHPWGIPTVCQSPMTLAGLTLDASRFNADLHATAEYRAHLVAVLTRRTAAELG